MNIEALEVRDALAEGAQRIIAANGYTGLKLEDILREAGLPEDILDETPDMKSRIIFSLGMRLFEKLQEESLVEGDVIDMLDSYLTSSIRILAGSSIELVQVWIEELVNEKHGYGPQKMRWDWESIARIIRAGIEKGQLREDTPVSRLTGLLLAQYYGILFAWCVMQGSMNAPWAMRFYVTETFPKLLAPYRIGQAET